MIEKEDKDPNLSRENIPNSILVSSDKDDSNDVDEDGIVKSRSEVKSQEISTDELCKSDNLDKIDEPSYLDGADVNSNNDLPGLLVEIVVEEARNLPSVKSKGDK